MSKIDSAMLAALAAARDVPVTKCATGETALGLSPREWRDRVRMTKDERREPDPTTIRRVACYDHLNRAVIVNGLGELVAVE